MIGDTLQCDCFSWNRVCGLLGIPYRYPQVQELFGCAKVVPDKHWREVRVGIYSMPPRDQEPCPIAEVDLCSTFRTRFRFKHADLLGIDSFPPSTFVMSSVTYFIDHEDGLEPFSGRLPFGIKLDDRLDSVLKRIGKPPSNHVFENEKTFGYVSWENQSPVLHILFNTIEQRPIRISVFLSEKGV